MDNDHRFIETDHKIKQQINRAFTLLTNGFAHWEIGINSWKETLSDEEILYG